MRTMIEALPRTRLENREIYLTRALVEKFCIPSHKLNDANFVAMSISFLEYDLTVKKDTG